MKTALEGLRKTRHALGVVAIAVAFGFGLDRVFVGDSPLLHRLSKGDRHQLYELMASFAGVLLGFVITSVAILVSLDQGRKIVKELQLASIHQ